MTKIRAHVYVTGRVQGVYFRQNTRQQAQLRSVKGWVRNLSDGRVEAVWEQFANEFLSFAVLY